MATVDNDGLVFYPTYCFRASPTHFTWVKMAITDVLRLKRRVQYADPSTYFYLNHPIRFVSVVGIIVSRTEVPRRTILTLDDSSGATIDVTILRSEVNVDVQANSGSRQAPRPGAPASAPAPAVPASVPVPAAPGPGSASIQPQTIHTAFTNGAEVDISSLTPGTVAHVKGTLSMFRARMQLQLERVFLVRDTRAEMRFVGQRSRYLAEVLAVPWMLSEMEVEQLRREADEQEERVLEERARGRRKVRKRAEREEKDQRRIWRLWEREEKVRDSEAAYCREQGLKVMRDLERKRVRGEM